MTDLTTTLAEATPGNAHVAADGTYKVDISQGTSSGALNAQWASRPADQRYTSVEDLLAAVLARKEESTERDIAISKIAAVADGPANIKVKADGTDFDLTNWSFQQLCWAADSSPSRYLSRLPNSLAVECLNHGLAVNAAENGGSVKMLLREQTSEMRAITSPRYGRIWDADVVGRVAEFCGRNPEWKVPGMLDWSSYDNGMVTYNPNVDVTKENTTLYASDRDCFIFLVDDRNPIQIGTLPNGAPDLVFRGLMLANSETGSRKFELTLILLRGVCANRCLWGIDKSHKISIRHSRFALTRFEDALPVIETYASMKDEAVIGVVSATRRKPLIDDEHVIEFLGNRLGLSKKVSEAIIALHIKEEGGPILNVWDAITGVTAYARGLEFQDQRVALEQKASGLLIAA